MSMQQDDFTDSLKRDIEDRAIGMTKTGKALGALKAFNQARNPVRSAASDVFQGVIRGLGRRRLTRGR